MTAPEPLFTLAQAKAELAKEECMSQGHDLATGFLGAYTPTTIQCARCGAQWTLTPS
jgi:hypothetical protein